MKKIIILLCMVFCSVSLMAQVKVSGTVRDGAGNPIAGATVVQKGTNVGVVVDDKGKFTINLSKSGQKVLEVSMLGYTKQEVPIGNRTTLNVELVEEALGMEEVVVVGFGTQKKASITGAINNIGGEELKSTPTSSVTNALTGRIPGLVTRQTSGRPGDDGASMFVRGRASFNSSSPLVLVDGIERSMGQIDPEDVASISVLKDASATAVYGVRGANGVILITTKRGSEGDAKVSLTAEAGITSYIRLSETLNAENVGRFAREGLINAGLDPSQKINTITQNIGLSEYDMHLYRTQKSPFSHPDNNFADIFTKPGLQQKYNVNISGGTSKVKYFFSVGYFSQDGMFQTDVDKLREHPTFSRMIELSPAVDKKLQKPDWDPAYKFHRLSTRSNVDIKLTDDFSMAIDLTYRFTDQNRPAGYDNIDGDSENMRLFGMFYRNPPQGFPLMNENGSLGAAFGVARQNPLATLCYTGFRRDFSNLMETNFSFRYNLRKLLKGLSVDGRFSYDIDWSSYWGVIERPYAYGYNQESKTYEEWLPGTHAAHKSDRKAASYKKYGEVAFRYKNTFEKKHNVSAVALATYTYRSVPEGKYSYVPHIYQALIGRANYDYDNRYLFEVNLGYNGSNRFSKGNRYQLFPAASLGWVLTNEPYFPKNKVLTYFKLRGSYGEVGNDNLGKFSYYYLSNYVAGTTYGFGEVFTPIDRGLREGALGNMMIQWEVAKKANIGVDSKWLDGKVDLNVDFFREKRSNILCEPERLVLSSGVYGVAPENAGVVENKGFEMEIGYQNNIGKLDYFVRGVYSYARNKILEKKENLQPYPYLYETGNPIGQYIGYHFDGFFDSYEQIAASPQQFGLTNLAPGDIKYKDINGDGVVDENDRSPIMYNTIPEMTFSLSAGISWKGLDVSVLFQGAARATVYMTSDLAWDNSWGNYFEEHIGRWTPETAAEATYPRFQKKAEGTHQNYNLSDYWLRDGSYLRLKNAQIGYSLPRKWFKKTPISRLRVYANGFNLWTWDKVKKIDPESPERSNGYFYPQQKIFNFGVNVTF